MNYFLILTNSPFILSPKTDDHIAIAITFTTAGFTLPVICLSLALLTSELDYLSKPSVGWWRTASYFCVQYGQVLKFQTSGEVK